MTGDGRAASGAQRVADARGVVWSDVRLLGAAQYLGSVLGLTTTVWAANELGPDRFGLAVTAVAFPTLLWTLASLKSSTAATRYLAALKTQRDSGGLLAVCRLCYGIDVGAAALAALVVLVAVPFVASALKQTAEFGWMCATYAVFLPVAALDGTSYSVLEVWRRFRMIAIFIVAEKSLSLLVFSWLLHSGWGAWSLVIALAAGPAAGGFGAAVVALWVMNRDGLPAWWRGGTSADLGSLRREIVGFFGWNYLFVTMTGAATQLPILLLARLRGPTDAAFFRVASSLAIAASYVESSMARVTYPQLSARKSSEPISILPELQSWTRQGGQAAVLVLCGIALLPVMAGLVFGAAYQGMIAGAQVMLLGTAATTLVFWVHSYYCATGRIGVLAQAHTAYTVVLSLATALAATSFGFVGVAVAVGCLKITLTSLLATGAILVEINAGPSRTVSAS